MARLITSKQVRTRFSLADDDGINESIKSAMSAAMANIGVSLDTEFDKGTAGDIFFVDPNIETQYAGHYTLKLGNGFIRRDAPIEIFEGYTVGEAMAETTITVPGVINYEKGYVQVEHIPGEYRGKFYKVTYDYGFNDGDFIPVWLQEMMIAFTGMVLSAQQISDGKPELSNVFKFNETHIDTIMVQHLRINSLAVNSLT